MAITLRQFIFGEPARSTFDPNVGLLGLPVVRRTMIFVFLAAAVISLVITLQSWNNLVFDPSYAGFNNLLVVYRVPLGLLALLVPLIAMYGANHRSEQTKAQINAVVESQLITARDNHRERFTRDIIPQFENSAIDRTRITLAANRLYDAVYPNGLSTSKNDIGSRSIKFVNLYSNFSKSLGMKKSPDVFTILDVKALNILIETAREMGFRQSLNYSHSYNDGGVSEIVRLSDPDLIVTILDMQSIALFATHCMDYSDQKIAIPITSSTTLRDLKFPKPTLEIGLTQQV
jgi:hypothetical protein